MVVEGWGMAKRVRGIKKYKLPAIEIVTGCEV